MNEQDEEKQLHIIDMKTFCSILSGGKITRPGTGGKEKPTRDPLQVK